MSHSFDILITKVNKCIILKGDGMMNTLITGINGFVGSYLAKYLLAKGEKVTGTVYKNLKTNKLNDNIKLVKMDIRNYHQIHEVIKILNPSHIYHLAANSSITASWSHPVQIFETNVNGTLNLLQAVRNLKIDTRILLIGSSEQYGMVNKSAIPISEKMPMNPISPYGISKLAQELLGKQYVEAYNLDIVMTRSFNHIGVGQSEKALIPRLIKNVVEIELGLREPIIKVGKLDVIRDFSHVRSVVEDYYSLMLDGISGEVYNIGSGYGYQLAKILNYILSLCQKKREIKIIQDFNQIRPVDNQIIVSNTAKITSIVGKKRKMSWEVFHEIYNYWYQRISTKVNFN